MAINNPRIAGQPFARRETTRVVAIAPWYEIGTGVDHNGFPNSSDPRFEGQLYYQPFSSGDSTSAELYVAVNINNILQWVIVSTGVVVNASTGAEWNSFFD